MQLGTAKKFHKRALYYAAKAYCAQRASKVDHKDLGEVYFLRVLKKESRATHNMSRKEKWAYFLKYAEDMT